MLINIRKLRDDAILPTRGSQQAAGYDLYCPDNIKINPGETVKVGLGLSMEIPDGYFGGLFARSGVATKQGLRPANCVGVIDSDYRGEIIMAVHNDSQDVQSVSKGSRIGQIIILPYLSVEFREVEELSETQRNEGGYGSTGK